MLDIVTLMGQSNSFPPMSYWFNLDYYWIRSMATGDFGCVRQQTHGRSTSIFVKYYFPPFRWQFEGRLETAAIPIFKAHGCWLLEIPIDSAILLRFPWWLKTWEPRESTAHVSLPQPNGRFPFSFLSRSKVPQVGHQRYTSLENSS